MSKIPMGIRNIRTSIDTDLLFRHKKEKIEIIEANKYFAAKIPDAPSRVAKR